MDKLRLTPVDLFTDKHDSETKSLLHKIVLLPFVRLKEFYNYKETLGDEYMDYNLVMATNSFVGSNLR